MTSPSANTIRLWQLGLLAFGAVCVGLFFIFRGEEAAEVSLVWLLGYLPVWEASVGCLGILLLYHLTGGRWGKAARPALESGAFLLPLVGLAVLPIVLQVEILYPWAGSEALQDPLLQAKSAYLNVGGFRFRALLYFLVWISCYLSVTLPLHLTPPREDDPQVYPRRGAFGLVLLVLAASFAAVDWCMSLEPHWFSSMYGAIYVISSATVAMGLSVFAVAWFPDLAVGVGRPAAEVCADIGTLMLAMLMVWAYFTFSQFLIIWSGDLPEENIWYLKRAKGGWQYFPIAIVLLGFVVPFFSLLSVDIKQNPRRLAIVVCLILAAQSLHIVWMVAPARYATLREFPSRSLLVLIGMPSLWAALWLFLVNRRVSKIRAAEPSHV